MSAIMTTISNYKVPILTVGGTIVGAAGIGLAVYNSIEYGEELKEKVSYLNIYRENHRKGEIEQTIDGETTLMPYTDEMYKFDRKEMVKDILRLLAKMYGLSAGLIFASAGCFYGAIGIQTKNLSTAIASFNALSGVYEQYRSKVIDKIGEEEEKKLRLGLTEETVTETVVDEKTGKKKEVKKKVLKQETDPASLYVYYYDESTEYNRDSPELNGYPIRAIEKASKDRLEVIGYVYLKDVLENLGLFKIPPKDADKETKEKYNACLNTGWKKGSTIDFRACPIKRMKNGEMIDTWILDFNVDGDLRVTD